MDKINVNVVSLFDGVAMGRQALEDLKKFNVLNYFSSEVDKNAIAISKYKWPNNIHLGDVNKVKIRTLNFSEIYSFMEDYDNNLQSKIQEWEMLYWLNEEFTMSATTGTQDQNGKRQISESSVLQCFKEIRFSKCGMGSISKFENVRGSRAIRDKNDSRNKTNELQCSSRGWGYGLYGRNKKENIKWPARKAKIRTMQEKNFGNIEIKIFRPFNEGRSVTKYEKSYVEARCSSKLLRIKKKNRLQISWRKGPNNKTEKKLFTIPRIIRKLQIWHENDRIKQDYWNTLRLYPKTQVTVVECEYGIHIFKGVFQIVAGGSPCKSFSFAGKQLNFDDPNGQLFYQYVRLLKEIKPTYFLFENVNMKKKFQDIISSYLGVEPIRINSSTLTAQRRDRLYWTNIPNITIPQPNNTTLNSILQDNSYSEREKSLCVLASYANVCCNDTGIKRYQTKSMGQLVRDSNGNWRKLSPIETERLQGLPDDYTKYGIFTDKNGNQITKEMSSYARYKAVGNGWTVPIISHILNGIKG